MKVIYTDQAIESLEESIRFYIEEQGLPPDKIDSLIEELFNRADSLETTYNHYQEEPDLAHLGKGHRRAIEGYFKIIYLVEEGHINITDFFDTRQDPAKMKG